MSDYGTVAGVAAYVRYIAFDTPNNPTMGDVSRWLSARSAQLTSWLAAAGYAVPVGQAEAKAVLDRYADIGAAGDAELSMRSSGANPDSDNARENTFLREFARAEAWINSKALLGLGVGQATTEELIFPPAAVGQLTTTAPVAPPIGSFVDANDRTYRGDAYAQRARWRP